MEDPKHTKERMNERLAMMHKLYSDSEVKHFFSPSEPITNADRIRSMTDEELTEWASIREMCFIYHLLINDPDSRNRCRIYENCKDCWLDWLKQEAT